MTTPDFVAGSATGDARAGDGGVSFVVPVFNEAASLPALYDEIVRAAARIPGRSEILFIDDGSTDGGWPVIRSLADRDERVSGVRLRRNFGKAAALTAGFRAARSEWLLMLDADLQDDPGELVGLLRKADEGFDVVNGWKLHRLDPWHKVYPSRVFNWMVSWLTSVPLHDHNCGLKLLHRDVMREVRLYGELHRFIPVLAAARGFRVAEQPVHHRSRQHGHSKYGMRRFLRGFLDLLTVKFLTGYGTRPQHVLGATGLALLGAGMLILTCLAVDWLLMNVAHVWPVTPIGTRPLLFYGLVLTMLGGQALSLGLLAELLVHYVGRPEDSYSVAEETCTSPPVA